MTAGLALPVFCLVTDRHQLRSPDDSELVRLTAGAAAAGANLIQIRERDLDDRRLLSLTRAIVRAVAGTAARVVVNDRIDIALAAGADGVQLRTDSPPAELVRSVVPADFLIGRSVHDEAEAVAAARTGVDYLILGTIFRSASKPAATQWLGPEGLGRVARTISVPLLAIGGVTVDKVGTVAAAGAAGFAAIGLFAEVQRDATDEALDTALRSLMADLRAAFRRGAAPR